MAAIPRWLAIQVAVAALGVSITIASQTALADDRAEAGNIYVELCVKCHGFSGRGDGPASPVLQITPGDLTDCKRMSQFSDDTLFRVIKYGGAAAGLSPAMPRFEAGLQDQEMSDLVGYIRAFCIK